MVVGTGGACFHHLYALKKLNFSIDIIGNYKNNIKLYKDLFGVNFISNISHANNKYKLVLINKPFDEHYSNFLKYQSRGEIVLIEKPICSKLSELKKMFQIKNNLYEVNQQIYNPVFKRINKKTLQQLTINFVKKRDVKKYSLEKLLSLHLPHALDIANFFSKGEILLHHKSIHQKKDETKFRFLMKSGNLQININLSYSINNSNSTKIYFNGIEHNIKNTKYYLSSFERFILGKKYPSMPIKEFYFMYKSLIENKKTHFEYYSNKVSLINTLSA